MIPISQLNNLRQQLSTQLEQALIEKDGPDGRLGALDFWANHKGQPSTPVISLQLVVEVEDDLAAQQAIDAGAHMVYVHLNKQQGAKDTHHKLKKKNARVYGLLPRIMREQDCKKILHQVESLKGIYDGFVAPSIGAIRMLQKAGIQNIWGDYALNVTNDMALYHLQAQGLSGVCLSPELTLEEMSRFTPPIELEAIVHGNLSLMNSAYCAVGAIEGNQDQGHKCQMPCKKDRYHLRDRKDYLFPLLTLADCTMQVLNAREMCNIEEINSLKGMGIGRVRLMMRERSNRDVSEVTSLYRQAIDHSLDEGQVKKMKKKLLEMSPYGFTKGHYYREVE